jgi:hypothetical protein
VIGDSTHLTPMWPLVHTSREFGTLLNLEDLIDDDSIVAQELSLLASKIIREICDIS